MPLHDLNRAIKGKGNRIRKIKKPAPGAGFKSHGIVSLWISIRGFVPPCYSGRPIAFLESAGNTA